MPAHKKVDYGRIEAGWRAGVKTPQQLADEYTAATGVSASRTGVIKHFTKLGIPRDLTEKVKAKSNAMVLASMVSGKVSAKVSAATPKPDSEIINDVAMVLATVQMSHRKDRKSVV